MNGVSFWKILFKDLHVDLSYSDIFSSSHIFFIFQSLSDEDSFKKMSSTKEVLEKIQELLSHLVERWDTFVIYLKLSMKMPSLMLSVCLFENQDAQRWQAASNLPACHS